MYTNISVAISYAVSFYSLLHINYKLELVEKIKIRFKLLNVASKPYCVLESIGTVFHTYAALYLIM